MATTLVGDRLRAALGVFAECVEACEACARRCIDATTAGMLECTKLCLDCATPALRLRPESRFAADLCRRCADAGDACAAECEKIDDDVMRACAEAWRRATQPRRQVTAA